MALIVIDFDGVVVENWYPEIGPQVPGAVEALRELTAAGHTLCLHSNRIGPHLRRALDYLSAHNIDVDVNVVIVPKPRADLIIDSKAAGCPIRIPPVQTEQPSVNWIEMRKLLVSGGWIPPNPTICRISTQEETHAASF